MPVTPISNTDFFMNMGKSILGSCVDALQCNGLAIPDRLYVGFDRPPQDCCPELTVWVGNIRTWDVDFDANGPNLRMHNGYCFDVTIRIGRCYLDMDKNGQPLDTETIEDWTRVLYRDAAALYFGWIGQWRGNSVSELTKCDLVKVSPMSQYHEGGCAGHEFTVTVDAG